MHFHRNLAVHIQATLCGLFVAVATFALPPQVKLNATGGAAGDLFGRSVAISGDTAIVGADQVDDMGGNSGAAYIFERGPSSWGQVTQLTASNGAADDHFGYSVALDRDTAIVGAQWADNTGADSGSAYIFERDLYGPNNWGEAVEFTAIGVVADDRFGHSVALDGDIAIVGAPGDDIGKNGSGAAYIFVRDKDGADKWGQVAKLKALDADVLDSFGRSVSISCNTAIVGAHQDGSESGAAYVFQRDRGGPDQWEQVAKLTGLGTASGDRFGWSVSLSGDTALIGAFQADGPGLLSGAAYVFERDQGGTDNWGQVTKLTAMGAGSEDHFGNSVSLSGDTAVIGAYWTDDANLGVKSGAAYIFERDAGCVAGSWGQVAKVTAADGAADDLFGAAVAIDGDTMVVGAYQDDDLGNLSGSAYVFHPTGSCP